MQTEKVKTKFYKEALSACICMESVDSIFISLEKLVS